MNQFHSKYHLIKSTLMQYNHSIAMPNNCKQQNQNDCNYSSVDQTSQSSSDSIDSICPDCSIWDVDTGAINDSSKLKIVLSIAEAIFSERKTVSFVDNFFNFSKSASAPTATVLMFSSPKALNWRLKFKISLWCTIMVLLSFAQPLPSSYMHCK